ncbi:MAG: thiamine-phosphate kinase [Candidatus Thorarchaeota archaeon]|nr:thiamine-phosphate kinase [Candidatus Thorarchaeota archaeon]
MQEQWRGLMLKTGEMGERDFLAKISSLVNKPNGAVLGFDDDASDIPLSDKNNLVINVDTFVRKTDWLPGMTPAQVGRKTAVMALSDLAAKGVKPLATMLSLCVLEDYDVEDASELIRGYSQFGLKHSVPYLGGDIGMCDDVVLTGVAFGTTHPDSIVSRCGAKEGDFVAVTGDFGFTSVAFEILIRKKKAEAELRKDALAAAFRPEINLEFVSALKTVDAVTASMDSSDGLGITLHTIAKQSECGMVIDNLPVSSSVEAFCKSKNQDLLKFVTQGGEEFLLVLTIPPDKFEQALKIAKKKKMKLRKIGFVTSKDQVVWNSEEGHREIPSSGYDNFREWD